MGLPLDNLFAAICGSVMYFSCIFGFMMVMDVDRFMNSAGEESVVNFAFEDDFVVDFRNALTPEPSEVSIIAGSECEIRYVHVSEIKKTVC